MALDQDTVRRIARLARIRVPEEELDGLAGELDNILGWIEQLDPDLIGFDTFVEGQAPHVLEATVAWRDASLAALRT